MAIYNQSHSGDKTKSSWRLFDQVTEINLNLKRFWKLLKKSASSGRQSVKQTMILDHSSAHEQSILAQINKLTKKYSLIKYLFLINPVFSLVKAFVYKYYFSVPWARILTSSNVFFKIVTGPQRCSEGKTCVQAARSIKADVQCDLPGEGRGGVNLQVTVQRPDMKAVIKHKPASQTEVSVFLQLGDAVQRGEGHVHLRVDHLEGEIDTLVVHVSPQGADGAQFGLSVRQPAQGSAVTAVTAGASHHGDIRHVRGGDGRHHVNTEHILGGEGGQTHGCRGAGPDTEKIKSQRLVQVSDRQFEAVVKLSVHWSRGSRAAAENVNISPPVLVFTLLRHRVTLPGIVGAHHSQIFCLISDTAANQKRDRGGLATGSRCITSQEEITLHRSNGGVAITTLSCPVTDDCMTQISWSHQYRHQGKHNENMHVY